jgi:hypothetical protein
MKKKAHRGRAPRTTHPDKRAPLTFTEQMRRLDATDPSHRPPVSGDSPRASWMTAQQAIAQYERRFNETNNPVFVLEALYWAFNTGESEPAVAWGAAPTWVMEYVVQLVMRTHPLFTSRTPPKKPQTAMYRALGFAPSRRASNPVRVLVDDFHDQQIALQVLPHVRKKEKPDHVYEAVAREHPTTCYLDPKCKKLSRATIRRCWLQYGPALQRTGDVLDQINAYLDACPQGTTSSPATSLKAIEEEHYGKDAAQKFTISVSFLQETTRR